MKTTHGAPSADITGLVEKITAFLSTQNQVFVLLFNIKATEIMIQIQGQRVDPLKYNSWHSKASFSLEEYNY